MTISFNQIPANIRVPGAYVEIDNSQAISGLSIENPRILVIGQRLSTGTVAAGIPTLVTSKANAITYFGRGSNIANMFDRLFDNNSLTEKWAIALDDNGAGVQATGTLTVTGTATAAGTISLYIGGVLVQTLVASGDVQNAIATAIAAAINANGDLPVTAGATTNVVTVTARHKGEIGNDIDLRLNYGGDLAGEKLPAGVAIAIVAMASGASNPNVDTAISAMPSEIFNYWLCPYTDTTNLVKFETELNRRDGPTVMLEGHLFTAKKGSVATLTTFGGARNNQHVTCIDSSNDSPSPAYLWAAAYCGQVSYAAAIDPARPNTTLPMVGILAPPRQSRRTQTERESLLNKGIATHTVSRDGTVRIERDITMYQTSPAGAVDTSYLDNQTPLTLSNLRQNLKNRILQKYPRHKLADDGTRFGAGQAIVTPKIIKGEIVALAGLWEEAGLVEDMDSFKKLLIVERNINDRNRVDCQLPPNLVNQFRVLAASLMFRI